MFLIDGSASSNTSSGFKDVLQFVKQVISTFKAGKDSARFAVVAYSQDAKVIYGFKESTLMEDMEQAFKYMKFSRNDTHMGLGLTLTKEGLFDVQTRGGAHKVLVVLTGAPSIDSVAQPSRKLRNMGGLIFSIGVGEHFDENQLNEMATDPDSSHVFTAKIDEMHNLVDKLKNGICQGRCTFSSC